MSLNVDSDARTEGTQSYAVKACLFASLGGLAFGYDQGITGPVQLMQSFMDDFCIGWENNSYEQCTGSYGDESNDWQSFLTKYYNLFTVGCIVGAFLGGLIADRFGRRVAIFSASLLYVIGVACLAITPAMQHTLLLVARAIEGIGAGMWWLAIPIYGAEIAPKELRGFLAGLMQVTMALGSWLSMVVMELTRDSLNNWRVISGVVAVVPLILMIGTVVLPESPRWNYMHTGRDATEATLKRIRETNNVGRELEAIANGAIATRQPGGWRGVFSAQMLKRVVIAMGLRVLQSWTGLYVMYPFGSMALVSISGNWFFWASFFSMVTIVSTMVAMRWVDTVGRRQLLLIGTLGMVLCLLLTGAIFAADCSSSDFGCSEFSSHVIAVAGVLFVFNFSISWGPVCLIYPVEIFPTSVRAKAVALSTMSAFIMTLGMTEVMKAVADMSFHGQFFLFSVTATMGGVFVHFNCPETKGMMLEDVDKIFRKEPVSSPIVVGKYAEVETPIQNV